MCPAGLRHAVRVNLETQIREARQALTDLCADETELTRLEAEQARELGELRAGGSRDFASLATLEGKRAALASMLAEQRGHVAQARETLAGLEVQAGRERLLDQAGEIARGILTQRAALDAGLYVLFSEASPRLLGIIDAAQAWEALRQDWHRLSRELGVNPRNPDEGEALAAELAARGVPVEMLTLTRSGGRLGLLEQFDPWPLPMYPEAGDDLPTRLRIILQAAALEALSAPGYANGLSGLPVPQDWPPVPQHVVSPGGYRDPLRGEQ